MYCENPSPVSMVFVSGDQIASVRPPGAMMPNRNRKELPAFLAYLARRMEAELPPGPVGTCHQIQIQLKHFYFYMTIW
ncbi:hypothetical protein NN561_012050 [Cricetulus griseus]